MEIYFVFTFASLHG